MISALGLVILRDWRLHKLRFVLTAVGIALGVAVFFSIRTTNTTLVDSLKETIEKLAGRATLQVVAGESGFSEEIVRRIRAVPGVQIAEPVSETVASTALGTGDRVLILGLDTTSDLQLYGSTIDRQNLIVKNPLAFQSKADSAAVTQTFATRYGLHDGDKFIAIAQTGPVTLTVRGIFGDAGIGQIYDGNVVVMDIYSAQSLFGRGKRIDRIDVLNDASVRVDELQQRIEQSLPPGIKVMRPNLRGESLENAVASINYGLTIMSFLALTIGVFIIYNSFSISLSQRWKELGILRAIGVERGNVQRMFLGEAAVLGIVGSVVGVAAGYGLARFAMRYVGNVTASYYGFTQPTHAVEFNTTFAVQALVAGIIASVIAAWLPAKAAADLEPLMALHNIESRSIAPASGWRRVAVGLAFLIAGVLLTAYASMNIGWNIQLFYSVFTQIGLILLVPKFIEIGGVLLRPVMRALFGVEGTIAVESMVHAPRRTTSTVIALMIGLSFVVSNAAFIQSQKRALDRSLDKAVAADILVSSSSDIHSRTYHFSEETAQKLGALPDVERWDGVRISSVEYDGDEIAILSHDMRPYFEISPDLLDNGDRAAAIEATAAGTGVIVSNNFATRFIKRVGDRIELQSPSGPVAFTIVGTLDYYRSEKGTVFFDRSIYKKYWGDSDVDYVFIDAKAGADVAAIKAQIQAALGNNPNAFIYTHEEYKSWVSVIVDQFFALMYVQMFIAACVAVLGLVNTMLISVAERKREIGIFRAIGGLRRQVAKMVMLEAVAISIIGSAIGLIGGVINSYFLVTVAARIIAGYSLPLVFPLYTAIGAIPIAIILALFSAGLPARGAARLNVVEAIGYE